MTEEITVSTTLEWFLRARPVYESLSELVRGTIERLIINEKIDFLSVTQRTKSIKSFTEKISRKMYVDPAKQMTDLSGIRVITFIDKDVNAVCDVIRKSFKVDENKSLNKADELSVDRFGYRSIHFVCDLGEDRSKLPEFKLFENMQFELQVRTVLQHAWAEIEHDRNYKLSGVLPTGLQRRLYSVAGVLEMADREFNAIATELDLYAEEVAFTTKKGDLDVELNSTSVSEYLKTKVPTLAPNLQKIPEALSLAIEELRDLGISSLAQLDRIVTPEIVGQLLRKGAQEESEAGVLRSIMMFSDIERYFAHAWKEHWTRFTLDLQNLLIDHYGEEVMEKIAEKYFHDPEAIKSKRFISRKKRSVKQEP